MTTISPQEDRLITAARLMEEDQLNVLVDFVNKLVIKKFKTPTPQSKQEFVDFLNDLGVKTEKRGLTPEILEEILADDK